MECKILFSLIYIIASWPYAINFVVPLLNPTSTQLISSPNSKPIYVPHRILDTGLKASPKLFQVLWYQYLKYCYSSNLFRITYSTVFGNIQHLVKESILRNNVP